MRLKTTNLDRQADREATDKAAASLTTAMSHHMSSLVQSCEGNVAQLKCCESMLTQMIDGMTEDRSRVQRAIQALQAREN